MNMVKTIIILLIFILSLRLKTYSRQSNLPIIDTNSIRNWPGLIDGSGSISNNGLYAGYSISKSTIHLYIPEVYIFKSLKNDWKLSIDSMETPGTFSKDNRLGFALKKNNELCIIELGKGIVETISDVKYYKLITIGTLEYLVYSRQVNKDELIIRNLSNNFEHRFTNIVKYAFAEMGGYGYLLSKNGGKYEIDIISILNGKRQNIWNGAHEPSSLIIDSTGSQLCFKLDTSLLYYNVSNKLSPRSLTLNMTGDCSGLITLQPTHFSPSGRLLFIHTRGPVLPLINPNVNPVQIFSYQDPVFDLYAERTQPNYLCAYEISSGKIIRLENENEHFRTLSSDEKIALISKRDGDQSEYYWNKMGLQRDYIKCLNTRKNILLERRMGDIILSPSGTYVVYQTDWGGDLYCLNFLTETTTNLTEKLPIPIVDDVSEMPMTQNSRGLEFYNWSQDKESIIIYDRYDIWLIDINGHKPPVNLTNGYGRKTHTVFRFCQNRNEDKINKFSNLPIIISAFNEDTKKNGFYMLNPKVRQDPTLLTMGDYVYYAPGQAVGSIPPTKAQNKNIWLVWRMSAQTAPNYYWTKNFKDFMQISDLNPEKEYQWYTTELINFTTKNGIKNQMVLYKPDNFDSTKKYPVLFNYYEHESAKLNAYRYPGITDNYCFNYPMMLARGYLICQPDIHFKIGETANSIIDGVESAADYLSKLPFIDSAHYGLCGGSFGGYATNCLATFSSKFAAAVSISGISDLISLYGNVPGLRDEECENRQLRMATSLSTNPERYLRNSPVVYTKNVTTPILIVNTAKDWNVNVQQGIEFFISLRREGKQAWMLRYQYPGHGIFDLMDQYDLYMRMTQFFDHYLKGVPAPIWMTKGMSIPATGGFTGFELDDEIRTPLPSSLLFKSK